KIREYTVTLGSHQHIVLDTNSNLFFRDVYAGLGGNHHVRLKRPRCLSDVMDLKADMMAGSMDKIFFVSFGSDVRDCRAMHMADPGTGLHFIDCLLLHVQNELVNYPLPEREFSRNRICMRHICGVAAVRGADIDNNRLPGLHLPRVVVVME